MCKNDMCFSFNPSEKQRQLEAIRERLAAQLKQKMDDEDERIREAVREAEEKRTTEEAQKENKTRKLIQEQAEHRHMQVGVLGCGIWVGEVEEKRMKEFRKRTRQEA